MAKLEDPWRSKSAYLYVLELDEVSLAWEYLRRNAEYGQAWAAFEAGAAAQSPNDWALQHFEDPMLDARQVHASWLPEPASVVRVIVESDTTPANQFSFWNIPGRKTLIHDGARLSLSSDLAGDWLRMVLGDGVRDGLPFGFTLSSGCLKTSWTAISKLASVIARRMNPVQTKEPPARTTVLHLRMLQAVDGEQAGATQREIASTIFGEDEVFHRWSINSELRAQVRYTLRRGKQLVNGGYRQLLNANSATQE